MMRVVILDGQNTLGRYHNVRKPARTIPIVRDSPCQSKWIIVNSLALTADKKPVILATLVLKLLMVIAVSHNTLAI